MCSSPWRSSRRRSRDTPLIFSTHHSAGAESPAARSARKTSQAIDDEAARSPPGGLFLATLIAVGLVFNREIIHQQMGN
jgi:hypothetical protein